MGRVISVAMTFKDAFTESLKGIGIHRKNEPERKKGRKKRTECRKDNRICRLKYDESNHFTSRRNGSGSSQNSRRL